MKNLSFLFLLILMILTSCANEDYKNKIKWQDELDYFNGENAFYFVDVGGMTCILCCNISNPQSIADHTAGLNFNNSNSSSLLVISTNTL